MKRIYAVMLFSFALNNVLVASGTKGYIENKGQIIDQNSQPNPAVKFLFNSPGLHIQLRANGFSFDTYSEDTRVKSKGPQSRGTGNEVVLTTGEERTWNFHRVDIEFVEANTNPAIQAEKPSSDYSNYYTTGTPHEGALYVRSYQKVTYFNLYPGIDLEFVLNEKQHPEYNFIVHPGADASLIRWKYSGADNISILNNKIRLRLSTGDFEEHIPTSYLAENTTKLDVNYRMEINTYGDSVYSFTPVEYDHALTLIIDPVPTVIWATYIGGNSLDVAFGIAIDTLGNSYTAGSTYSKNMVATTGAHQTTHTSAQDGFITMLSPFGGCYWSTYYGGGGSDEFHGIVAGTNGTIAAGGYSGSPNLGTPNAYRFLPASPGFEGILVKFNTSGIRVWATYYRTSAGSTSINGVAMDSNNDIYLIGNNSDSPVSDSCMVAKFTSQGMPFWQKLFSQVSGKAITTNGSNVYITGVGLPSSSIATSGAHQTTPSGVFIINLDPAGGGVQWATYYGGVNDKGLAITTAESGNVLVAGFTKSTTGIASSGAYQAVLSNLNGDAFIAKFTPAGTRIWGTYYGGEGMDEGTGITTRPFTGNIWLTGSTNSNNGIASPGAQRPVRQFEDAYIAILDSTGKNRIYGTYYGGDSADVASAISSDAQNNIVICGSTGSPGLATGPVYQSVRGGQLDAFTSRICDQYVKATGIGPTCGNGNITLKGEATSFSGRVAYYWTGPLNFSSIEDSVVIPAATGAHSGTYRYVAYDSSNSCRDTAYVYVTINAVPVTGFSQNYLSTCFRSHQFNFSDTSTISEGTIKRLWKFSNGDTSTSAALTKNFIAAGTYTVTLIETSDKNCRDSIVKTLQVNPQTSIGFRESHNHCDAHRFVFTDTSTITSGVYSRLWKFDDATTGTASGIDKTYAGAGTHIVRLVTTTNAGCMDSVQKAVTSTIPHLPDAGFTQNNLAHCLQGNNFILNDTSGINAGTFTRQWIFDDSIFNSNPLVSKSFYKAGIFHIKLLLISDENCRDSVVRPFTVHPQPEACFSINHTTQCLNNRFVFTDTTKLSGGTYSIIWDVADGSQPTAGIVNRTYPAGTFNIWLYATTINNCSDTAATTISVKPFPTPVAGFTHGALSQCLQGNTFSFADTSTISTGTISRQWIFSNGFTSTSANLNSSFPVAGSYIVKLRIISNEGCSDSAISTLQVLPQPVAGFTHNQPEQCLTGNTFNFTDTTPGSFSRLWTFGDQTTSVNPTVVKSYLQEGTYSVKLVIATDSSCTDSAEKTITVYPQTKTGFSVTGSLTQCIGTNTFTFKDTSRVSSGTYSLDWELGEGTTSMMPVVTKSYTVTGLRTVKLHTVTNQGCKDSAQTVIIVNPGPQADFSIDNPVQCVDGNLFHFTDQSTIPVLSYTLEWKMGDQSQYISPAVVKTFATAGTYGVQLKITDANNCADSIVKTVTVKPGPLRPSIRTVSKKELVASGSGIFTWYLNNDSIPGANTSILHSRRNGMYMVRTDSSNGCSSISDPLLITLFGPSDFRIYPNPGKGIFYLDFASMEGNKRYEVYDSRGKFIEEGYSTDFVASLDLSSYANGIYLLRIQAGIYNFNSKVIIE